MDDNTLILMAKAIKQPTKYNKLEEVEYSVFSQWGDDGIIQYLINHLTLSSDFFVEFGVEDYRESNTRFLLMNNNWSGLVIDGSKENINMIRNAPYFWKYDLTAIHQFVSAENINALLSKYAPKEIGLLHIDIDGVDYWIWKEISRAYNPDIVIVEYNSVFGRERSITVPYNSDFRRFKAHYSGLYAGASIKALVNLSEEIGYTFIGSNSAGNNAYFIKKDIMNEKIKKVSVDMGYRNSKFRESRNKAGKLSYLRGVERLNEIKGMPVINTITGETEKL